MAMRIPTLRAVAAAALLAACASTRATADDQACCADLDARIGALEEAALRKTSSDAYVEISGHVHRALLFWDDGTERNVYGNDPTNYGTFVAVSAETEFKDGWDAGVLLSLDLPLAESISLTQDTASTAGLPTLGRSIVFIASKDHGRLSWGRESEAHNHITELDLSGTGLFTGPGVMDWHGSFALRLEGQALPEVELSWLDISSASIGDGENASAIRYETPRVLGWQLATSWGSGAVSAVSAGYELDTTVWAVEAGIGLAHYGEPTRSPCVDREARAGCVTAAGSAAVKHKPSGLMASFAAGQIAADPEATGLTARDPDYWLYGKLAWQFELMPQRPTVLYGEAFTGRHAGALETSSDIPQELAFTAVTSMVGAGIMQTLIEDSLDVYMGWRHFEADLDVAGLSPDGLAIVPFDAVLVGSRITF